MTYPNSAEKEASKEASIDKASINKADNLTLCQQFSTPQPDRPSWTAYFMSIADLVATRSTCIRRKVGAVLVKDRRILCSGYNGAPSRIAHCIETGCLRQKLQVPSGEKHELCRGVHAEQNAIIQAACHGISVSGSTLYCTDQPCSICAKMIINAGIISIYFKKQYNDQMSIEMLKQAGVNLYSVSV